jgi:hypothetical protein
VVRELEEHLLKLPLSAQDKVRGGNAAKLYGLADLEPQRRTEDHEMKNARLLHYSHCVSDLGRSKRFYTEVLGFEVVAEFDFDDADTAR